MHVCVHMPTQAEASSIKSSGLVLPPPLSHKHHAAHPLTYLGSPPPASYSLPPSPTTQSAHPPTSPQAGVQVMKSQVELGPGVFCRALVPDTSRVFIAIGLGFHLEVELQEAGRVIDTRQEALRAQVEGCVDKAARIKAHLKFVAEAIRELTGL